jgi:hypothetical protein
MRTRPATIRDASIRAAILPGAVVAVLAVVGVEAAAKASIPNDRLAKTAWVGCRSTTVVATIARVAPSKVTWAAAAMLLLLAVGQPIDIPPPERQVVGADGRAGAPGRARLRRRHSISYRVGGRLGP